MATKQTEMNELRKFGVIFSCVFSALNVLRWINRGYGHAWPFYLAAVVFITALVKPQFLKPFHALLKAIFHAFTALILGLFFYLVITPVGLIMKIVRRDCLHRDFKKDATTYWISRDPSLSDPKRMERLF
ncbi:SxtJ family membrane protein [Candidatus Omnitrophota bacterium]